MRSLTLTSHNIFWGGVAFGSHDSRGDMGIVSIGPVFRQPEIRQLRIIILQKTPIDELVKMKKIDPEKEEEEDVVLITESNKIFEALKSL